MFDLFALGFKAIFQPYPLILLFLGTVAGIIVGCIPGFTITMGAALVLPLTFGMTSIQGLAAMIGVLVGGLAGGQITGILLGIPGTPSSVATVFDGHPMAKAGEPGTALATGTWASFFGGLISAGILMFFTPPLANVALKFGPWEFFSLVLFGLTIIASLSGKSLTKGIISGVIGLIAASVGTDPMTGVPRFNFGLHGMAGGFSFLPVLIGLFAFSQLMSNLEKKKRASVALIEDSKLTFSSLQIIKTILRQPINLIRSSLIGVFVGALPGAGGSIACILSYDQAKERVKTPGKVWHRCHRRHHRLRGCQQWHRRRWSDANHGPGCARRCCFGHYDGGAHTARHPTGPPVDHRVSGFGVRCFRGIFCGTFFHAGYPTLWHSPLCQANQTASLCPDPVHSGIMRRGLLFHSQPLL